MSDSGPGRREVAYRLFAAEFDDAEFSYSESDEERAPNFVVTPTGARVNRLFAVGVLTEVEDVNPEMVRGRVVDPTGAFVTYAGQYQPDELAFLDRVDPPTFLALSGKARTFEPEDGDRVFTSVRPESVSEVDAETRDRWVVTAAERTLDRVGVMASAIESGLTGDRLRTALEDAGVDERLADGVALGLEYYGTTPAYLEALRNTAIEALEVVAGERDEVGGLDVAPGEGMGDAAPLSTLELSVPATAEDAEPPADETPESAAAADSDDATDAVDTADEVADSADDTTAGMDAETSTTAATSVEPDAESVEGEEAESPAVDASGTEASTDSSSQEEAQSDAAATAEDVEAVEEEMEDFDPGEFELDEEERKEVEEEYGTEFSTADEVAQPDEELDVDSDAEPDQVTESEAETESGSEVEPEAEPEPGDESDTEMEAAAGAADDAEPEPKPDAETEAAEDTASGEADLDDAVVATMEDLDDGDGADREELVAAVAEEYGADPADVEEAIQDALMSGRCYEPADGVLKSI